MNPKELKELVKLYVSISRELKRLANKKQTPTPNYPRYRELLLQLQDCPFNEHVTWSLGHRLDKMTWDKKPMTQEQLDNRSREGFPGHLRIFHVAYSLWKGREYSQIEKPREENALSDSDWEQINELVAKFPIREIPAEEVA